MEVDFFDPMQMLKLETNKKNNIHIFIAVAPSFFFFCLKNSIMI